MTDTIPSSVYDAGGPYSTVYLDATRTSETGAHEIEVRWNDLRKELEQQGAPAADLDAIGDAVQGDKHTPGPHGLVVVASQGAVRLRGHLPEPPRTTGASFAPLPNLVPYLAQRVEQVPYVLVVADHSGAELFSGSSADEYEEHDVEGAEQWPLHKRAGGDAGEWHFDNAVENAWAKNARKVAEAASDAARTHAARVVLIAGDDQARSAVRDEFAGTPSHTLPLVELTAGGRAAGADRDALRDAVRTALIHQASLERNEVLDRLKENVGRHKFGAAGIKPVIDALRQAQVDTVVLSDDPTSTLRALIGPGPTDLALDRDDLTATGVTDITEDRLDAALLRAAVGTGANFVVAPGGHAFVEDGVGALLRFDE